MKKVLKWLAGISFIALLGSILFPIYVSSRRPSRQTFQITVLSSATSVNGLNKHTRQHVVSEGPCPGGCRGGVGYDGKSTNLIWLYNVKPISVTRRNDIWGDDQLTIHGRPTNDGRYYFASVPSTLTAPYLQWIYVKIDE